ncbi:MAG TPA: type II toxin-antitoxin system prevent-host-death family antitoxin [Burkholderiales bacterium]|jgi:prevent-host-death family protein|nr:type II toxin-antitoxin system prevent-host-death family antitoxin [Burkholderiales bacterium]HSA70142.1 type II toxin-antitoxin system prevent-host-death family antitoxin [Burkholderiales bacterium]
MDKLSVFEAKARFSEVVSRAEEGKQTVITKRGKAVARVVPEKAARAERWDRSGAIDRIVEFSKTCRTRRKVDLQRLIEEGRL